MFNPFMRYSSYYNPWQGGRGYNNMWQGGRVYNNLWRGGRGYFNNQFPGGNGYAQNVWQGNYGLGNQFGGGNAYTNNMPQGGYGYNMPQSSYGYMNGMQQSGLGYMDTQPQGGYGYTNDQWRVKRDSQVPSQGSYGFTNTPVQGVNGYANTSMQGVSGYTNIPLQGGNTDTNILPQNGSGYTNSNGANMTGTGRPADNTDLHDIKLIDNGQGPFIVDIGEAAKQNNAFRKAIWTGDNLQVTLMSVNSGEDIGFEVHSDLDQFISIEEGSGILVMGDKKENLDFHETISAGDTFIIPAGKWRNLVNSNEKPLKLYSVYTQPLYPSGAVHVTKADAKPAEDNKQEIVYVK